jgi:hypothetical protein
VKILEYKDMEPFFIKGECDEPCIAASRLRWTEVLWCLIDGGKRIIFAPARK